MEVIDDEVRLYLAEEHTLARGHRTLVVLSNFASGTSYCATRWAARPRFTATNLGVFDNLVVQLTAQHTGGDFVVEMAHGNDHGKHQNIVSTKNSCGFSAYNLGHVSV